MDRKWSWLYNLKACPQWPHFLWWGFTSQRCRHFPKQSHQLGTKVCKHGNLTETFHVQTITFHPWPHRLLALMIQIQSIQFQKSILFHCPITVKDSSASAVFKAISVGSPVWGGTAPSAREGTVAGCSAVTEVCSCSFYPASWQNRKQESMPVLTPDAVCFPDHLSALFSASEDELQ